MNYTDSVDITPFIIPDQSDSILEDLFLTTKCGNISVKKNELYPIESNLTTISLGALYNYLDDKDEKLFTNVYLPEFTISYCHFVSLFFSRQGKYFSSRYLNQFWNKIEGLSLQDIYIKTAELLFNIDYNKIKATTKIKLLRECCFSKITLKAHKTTGMNLEQFNIAIKNTDPRIDGSICSSATFHLYSNVLNVGIKLTQRFVIINIPNALKKKELNDKILFDYSNK